MYLVVHTLLKCSFAQIAYNYGANIIWASLHDASQVWPLDTILTYAMQL